MNKNELLGSITVRPLPVPPPYLKWHNIIVGYVNPDYTVDFKDDVDFPAKKVYGNPKKWSSDQFRDFLVDRLPSKDRRDIDKLLMRMNINNYNPFRIACITRAFNAKDLFWLSEASQEKMENVIPQVFKDVFFKSTDFKGQEIYSPEGVNIKRYSVSEGSYGILKKRLAPVMTDVESEVAVYKLATRLGIKCCPSWFVEDRGERYSFSKFEYDFINESLISYRRFFDKGGLTNNFYEDLVRVFPKAKKEIQRMIVLDFITRQDDRHLSNFAVKISNHNENVVFYPLYDNGRSLFYEDTEEMVSAAVSDVRLYATSFGSTGTYYDYVEDISKDTLFSDLVDLNITESEIGDIYKSSVLREYRLEGAVKWTSTCIEILKDLDSRKDTKINSFKV